MAKNRVGVLEAHEAVESSVPQTHCGRGIAERLVASREARRLGKRLIQMVRTKASEAIKQAKAARDAVEKTLQKEVERIMFYDGLIGIGNLIPFARIHSLGEKLHYEIPHAGDKGMRRHNLYSRRDEAGILQLKSKTLRVSSRNLFLKQPIPAVPLAV
jgi:hypothetical protein